MTDFNNRPKNNLFVNNWQDLSIQASNNVSYYSDNLELRANELATIMLDVVLGNVFKRLKPNEFFKKISNFNIYTLREIFKQGRLDDVYYVIDLRDNYKSKQLQEGFKLSLYKINEFVVKEYLDDYRRVLNAGSGTIVSLFKQLSDDTVGSFRESGLAVIKIKTKNLTSINIYNLIRNEMLTLARVEDASNVLLNLALSLRVGIADLRNIADNFDVKQSLQEIDTAIKNIKSGKHSIMLTDAKDIVEQGLVDAKEVSITTDALKNAVYERLIAFTGLPLSTFTGKYTSALGGGTSSKVEMIAEEEAYENFFILHLKPNIFDFLNCGLTCTYPSSKVLMLLAEVNSLVTLNDFVKLDDFLMKLGLETNSNNDNDNDNDNNNNDNNNNNNN